MVLCTFCLSHAGVIDYKRPTLSAGQACDRCGISALAEYHEYIDLYGDPGGGAA